jgi:hypothetical protein
MGVGESDGVRCIAGVANERAEIALKMEEVLFSFETWATEPNSTGLQTPQNMTNVAIDEILCGLF